MTKMAWNIIASSTKESRIIGFQSYEKPLKRERRMEIDDDLKFFVTSVHSQTPYSSLIDEASCYRKLEASLTCKRAFYIQGCDGCDREMRNHRAVVNVPRGFELYSKVIGIIEIARRLFFAVLRFVPFVYLNRHYRVPCDSTLYQSATKSQRQGPAAPRSFEKP